MKSLDVNKVKTILWKHWDPIGLGPLETAHETMDEYDVYAREVANLLEQHASIGELIAYLGEAEDHMGMPRSEKRIHSVAAILHSLAAP